MINNQTPQSSSQLPLKSKEEQRSQSLKWMGIIIFIIGLILFILKLIECFWRISFLYLPDYIFYVGLIMTILGFYIAFIASYKVKDKEEVEKPESE